MNKLYGIINFTHGAFSIFLLCVFSLMTMSYAECSVFESNKVLCRNSDGKVSVYEMFSKNSWKARIYYPKSDDQTDAVYVDLYKSFDIASVCMLGTEMNAFRDSVELTQEDRMVAKKNCEDKENYYLDKIKKGFEVEIPAFELAFGKKMKISAMYCMNPSYVRTYKYNKITQLETDRQDYDRLKFGTYCQDFLMARSNYWTP